jgi:hypothetical protein
MFNRSESAAHLQNGMRNLVYSVAAGGVSLLCFYGMFSLIKDLKNSDSSISLSLKITCAIFDLVGGVSAGAYWSPHFFSKALHHYGQASHNIQESLSQVLVPAFEEETVATDNVIFRLAYGA